MLLFLAFFVAFAIKVPLFPLHTWLPDAHVEAPTAGSVILAGVLLKMGTYGMIRFCLPLFPQASREAAPYVAALAIIGIIYGALVALVQPNLKKLVAYSSVSHLGFVVLGIFAFHNISMQGAVYQMLAHGISTGALFLLVGMLYDRRHTFEISQYGGLATPMPRLAAFFLFVALASLGLPMLNGFVGEFLILLGTYQCTATGLPGPPLGVILSACYLLWSYQRVFFGEVTVREKSNAARRLVPRKVDSRHHGRRHALDGRRLDVLHPPLCSLLPKRPRPNAAPASPRSGRRHAAPLAAGIRRGVTRQSYFPSGTSSSTSASKAHAFTETGLRSQPRSDLISLERPGTR